MFLQHQQPVLRRKRQAVFVDLREDAPAVAVEEGEYVETALLGYALGREVHLHLFELPLNHAVAFAARLEEALFEQRQVPLHSRSCQIKIARKRNRSSYDLNKEKEPKRS